QAMLVYKRGRLDEPHRIDLGPARNSDTPLSKTEVEQCNRAIAAIRASAEQQPREPGALLALGRLHAMKEEKDTALAYFNEVIRLEPKCYQAWFEQAAIKGANPAIEDVIRDCNEALRVEPDFADALALRSAARGELGRHAEALADINSALALNPRNA